MCPDKSTRPRLRKQGDVYVARWEKPDRSNVYALWTSGKIVNTKIRYSGTYSCYDIYGKRKRIKKDNSISPAITYFVGNIDFYLNIIE